MCFWAPRRRATADPHGVAGPHTADSALLIVVGGSFLGIGHTQNGFGVPFGFSLTTRLGDPPEKSKDTPVCVWLPWIAWGASILL